MHNIQIYRKKQKHMSKNQIRRFQRSYFTVNSPISTQTCLPSPIQHKQLNEQRGSESKNCSTLSIEANGYHIWNKIAQLQSFIELERYQRLRDSDKIKNMIKQMECKHSSIIYNSQIRYCKSPPKPDIFFTNNTKNKENTLAKCLSATNLNLQKENLSGLNLRANKAIIAKCADKMGNLQQRNILNECVDNLNPEKCPPTAAKSQNLGNRLELDSDFIKRLTDEVEQKIEDNFNKKLDILRKELINKIKINQEYADENLSKFGMQYENKLTNINSTIENFKQEIKDFNTTNSYLYETNLRQFSGQIKGLINSINAQFERKLGKIQQKFTQFKHPFNTKLQQICNTIEEQNGQIKKLDQFSQLNHNTYSNKIRQTLQFLNNKLNFYEKQQRQKKQNQLKENETEKQKIRLDMMKNIEETINNKSDLSKVGLQKLLSDRCQRIEDILEGTIERHIHYVEDYIRKNIEKENTIMRSYNNVYNDHR